MAQIYGAVEISVGNEWYEVIEISTLLLQHSDLNGCLFGVDNYGGFIPLFPDRGVPDDHAITLEHEIKTFVDAEARPSWVLWSELMAVDWSEMAASRDVRITEFQIEEDGTEQEITKWLNKAGLDWVREKLDQDPDSEVRFENRLFRRLILRRSDALTGTDFPLLMSLMACLAHRFEDTGVRLFVWFG